MKGKKAKKQSVGVSEEKIAAPEDSSVDINLTVTSDEPSKFDLKWFGSAGFIVALATFLRFYDLTLKVMHHDEGVNGHFLKTLINDGVYRYDPANYHGPTLYYISLAFVKVFGFETFGVRASVAIFGVLMVVLVLYLRDYLGRTGTLIAALFLTLSPGMVFISRYFIHEIFFVFLSLAIVVSVVFFMEKKEAGYGAVAWMALLLLVSFLPSALNLAAYLGGSNATTVWALRIVFMLVESALVFFVIRMLLGWDNGRPIYLILAAASISLFFATKETAFITLGTMLIALVSIYIWRKLRPATQLDDQWVKIIGIAHVFLGLLMLYNYAAIIDGFKWLYNFVGFTTFRPPEVFVFVSIFVLLAAAAVAWVMFLIDMRRANDAAFAEPVELSWANFRRSLGNNSNAALIFGSAAVVAVYLFILFFSSFFTYADGIKKAFEAYAIWTKTGNKDHTMHGYLGYVKWMFKLESAILVISILGILVTFVKAKHRFAMFTALWALGLLIAYSIIPYKTPWLDLSFILPMCMIAGYVMGDFLESGRKNLIAVAGLLCLLGSSVLLYQAYQLSFVRYDDDEMVYVYAHTRRGFLDMMREIDRYALKSGKGKDAVIEVVTPEYWPMTWYTKDYNKVNYFGSLIDTKDSEIIVFKKNDQDAAAIQRYGANYKYIGVYPLRPGVNLVLLVRKDLADANAQDVNKVLEYKVVQGYTN